MSVMTSPVLSVTRSGLGETSDINASLTHLEECVDNQFSTGFSEQLPARPEWNLT
jgi:hypothetical protein